MEGGRQEERKREKEKKKKTLYQFRDTFDKMFYLGYSSSRRILLGRTDAEAPILWPLDAKSRLIGKDSDAGKD